MFSTLRGDPRRWHVSPLGTASLPAFQGRFEDSGGRNCIMLSMGKETEHHGESLEMLEMLIGSYWIFLDLGWWWCLWSHHTELPGSEEVSDSRRLWRSWIESNGSDVFSQDCLKSAGWGMQGIGFTDKIYETCDRTSCGACHISR